MSVQGITFGTTAWETIMGLTTWNSVLKLLDETKTLNVVLAPDTTLQFPMQASVKYIFRMRVWFDTSAAADFKWRHAGPAAPVLVRIKRDWVIPGGSAEAGTAVDIAFSAADNALTGSGTTGGFIEVEGIIQNGANPGIFSFNWAQNTNDAGLTVVRAGSYIQWTVV